MPTSCIITFDHPDGVYYSGETLNGTVQLHTTKKKSIRGISVKLKGSGEVKWTEERSRQVDGKTEYYTETYYANEQYLNSVTYLVGSAYSNSFDLAPGTYNYTFSCLLPIGLPTTCIDRYGEINYKVTVTIDRPFSFDNDFKKPFTVKRYIDLNSNSNYKNPQKCEDEATGCCCNCFSCCSEDEEGTIKAELKTSYSGYAAGQSIPYKLIIANDSNTDVESVRVKVERIKTFESRTPSHDYKYLTEKLSEENHNSVFRLSRKEFSSALYIPNDQECTQTGHIISVKYELQAKIVTGCCISDIKLLLPITVGTIPIDGIDPTDVITEQPTAPVITQSNDNDNSPPVYISLDLPSYEEALKSNKSLDPHIAKQIEAAESANLLNNTLNESPTAPPINDGASSSNHNIVPPTSEARNGISYGWKAT